MLRYRVEPTGRPSTQTTNGISFSAERARSNQRSKPKEYEHREPVNLRLELGRRTETVAMVLRDGLDANESTLECARRPKFRSVHRPEYPRTDRPRRLGCAAKHEHPAEDRRRSHDARCGHGRLRCRSRTSSVPRLRCLREAAGRDRSRPPSSIVAACGDGNFWFGSLRWKTWSATGATAAGSAHQNDCIPYCAAGHFHAYAASVSLAGARRCAGKLELTRISWRFTKAKPAGIPRTGAETFRCG